jgi:hypothetical protein
MRPTVRVDGRTWNLFSVDYDTPDGKFSFYIYALSSEHASMIVEEIRATARVSGQVCGFQSADG